jgi:hypothetical protein
MIPGPSSICPYFMILYSAMAARLLTLTLFTGSLSCAMCFAPTFAPTILSSKYSVSASKIAGSVQMHPVSLSLRSNKHGALKMQTNSAILSSIDKVFLKSYIIIVNMDEMIGCIAFLNPINVCRLFRRLSRTTRSLFS